MSDTAGSELDDRFSDTGELNESLLKVHRKHLANHPHLREYDSAGEYFEREVGVENVADGYFELPTQCATRIHSYAPRDYLLLQKNPNLPTSWVKESVHWSYRDMARQLDESVRANVLQTAKTVSGYFNDKDTVRLGLKCIADAVQSELGSDFDRNAFRQSDFEEYIQLEAAKAYRDSREGNAASLGEGFHSDFAYSNRSKFQARGSGADLSEADDEWLADEIEVINPKVVFAMGRSASYGLRNIGFERLDVGSQYSDGDTGRVLRYEGDRSSLNGTYAVHLYHLDYRQTLTTDRDVHDALKALNEVAHWG